MEHVAHQTICMQYILELSRQLNIDPRACVPSFFSRYTIYYNINVKSIYTKLVLLKEKQI